LALTLLLTAAVPAASGQPGSGSHPSAVAKKKHRKKKPHACKKTQVTVTVNGRKLCRAPGAALPPPRAGDARLAFAQFALADDLGGIRDRHHRRPPSLQKLLRRVNPHASATLQSAIAQGLARLDAMAASQPNAFFRRAAPLGRLVPECAKPDAPAPPTQSDTFSSNSGGEKVTATVRLGRDALLSLGLEGGGYKIDLQLSFGECNFFNAPDCPTSAGVVDATDRSGFVFGLAVSKGGELIARKSIDLSGNTQMHAQVDDNARLDFIDIQDTQKANITFGGTKQEPFGPVNLIYTALHHTRVDMPAAAYVVDQSAVDISLTAQGVTVGRDALGAAGTKIASDTDTAFGELVNKEITNFKKLESDQTGWNKPNTCANLQFTPGSGTLTLHKGDHGTFSAHAVAVDDGGSPPGHWTLPTHANANVAPDSADGGDQQFTYDVTNAGRGVSVGATVHFVSKAGVAEAPWTQDTHSDETPLYVGQVDGSVSSDSSGGCDTHFRANFHSDLSRRGDQPPTPEPFALLDPSTDNHVSVSDDHVSGDATYSRDPCGGDPGCSESLQPSGLGDVQFGLEGSVMGVSASTSDWDSQSNACNLSLPGLGSEFASGSFPASEIGDQTIVVPISFSNTNDDGTTTNSGTLTLHRVN
jgi:hypothetical protein